MTIFEAVQKAKKCLEFHRVPDADIDALILLQSVCGISRAQYYARGGECLPDEDTVRYMERIRQRAARIPLQQITGEQYFCGLRFQVTKDVLCPRPETEILVEEARKRLKHKDRVLDLCTGSGCIAIRLLCMDESLEGCGCDISEEALQVAAQNAAYHSVSDRLELIRSDLFGAVDRGYDMIVSNPPYICTGVIPSLMEEVRDHEPHIALDGGADGLRFYRRILDGAGAHLKEGGWLILEIGYDQAEAVRSMLVDKRYESIGVIRDLSGMGRVVLGRRSH